MSTQQVTDELTSRQKDLLVQTLKLLSAADSAKKAVWLKEEDRVELRKILSAIQE